MVRKVLDTAAVFRETRKKVNKMVESGHLERPSQPSVYDFQETLADIPSCPRGKCTFAISADDTVTAVARVSAEAGCPAFALNFASPNMPGGAVASGIVAQEECLFRQTSIDAALPAGARLRCYPLVPGRVVLCRGVAVVRASHPSYEWLPEPFTLVDVGSSAAVQKPPPSACGELYADGGLQMRMRAASVLQAAASNGSRHLVLGAWGCGGFRNPARGLAQVFRELLVDSDYKRFFTYVEFAIPGHSNRHAAAFSKVWGDLLSQEPLSVGSVGAPSAVAASVEPTATPSVGPVAQALTDEADSEPAVASDLAT